MTIRVNRSLSYVFGTYTEVYVATQSYRVPVVEDDTDNFTSSRLCYR